MKNIVLFLLCLLSLSGFSQELVQKLNFNLENKTDVFQVVNEEKKQISLFFNDKKKVRNLLFNDKLQITDSLVADRPAKNFDPVGHSHSGNTFFSYWASSRYKEILVQNFDFDKRKVTNHTAPLELNNEKVIKQVTVNNKFYLLTLEEDSSILHLYFFVNGTIENKKLDVSNKRFLASSNAIANLWTIFKEDFVAEPSFTLQTIANDSPPSLIISAKKRKIYPEGNSIILTFDNNKAFTQVIQIDLNNFNVITNLLKQPYVEESDFSGSGATSFFTQGKFVQMKSNNKRMLISVKTIDGNEIKSHEILDDTEIAFSNSEIIQEKGGVNNTRVLEKSNQLLRKINQMSPAISCHTVNDAIYMTIGGISPPTENAVMYGGMFGGFTGAMIMVAITSNYSLNNLNSYNNRKVVYINCRFDVNFNHREGAIKKLAFDELRGFTDKINDLFHPTIFKMNNALYFGGYSRKEKNYSFYKFNDSM